MGAYIYLFYMNLNNYFESSISSNINIIEKVILKNKIWTRGREFPAIGFKLQNADVQSSVIIFRN